MRFIRSVFLAIVALLASASYALEYPIGTPQNLAGMEIAAVYLQPVEMEPEGHMRKVSESDIHLEADIHALANNPNGFSEGAWVPYLLVKYELTKVGTNEVIQGEMMPMVASDGPHYGDNVKLKGPGKYKLKFTIYPPNAKENPMGNHFGRHTDRATGVRKAGIDHAQEIAATLAAGFAVPAVAADDAVLAELKRLAERIEALEKQNKALERALASERISEKEPELATRLKYLEAQVDAVKGPGGKLAEALNGVQVKGSLTAVAQKVGADGTASGSSESRTNYRGDLSVAMPLGAMGESEGRFFTHLRLGQGKGVGLRPSYTSTPNTLAFEKAEGPDDSFAILAQAWYQLKMPLGEYARKEDAREHLFITVGKIDPFVFFDQNAIADDESAKFMNNVFVHNPLLDSGGDIGADAHGFQPGAIVKYENGREKGGEWALSLGAFASDSGANFSGSNRASFVIGQIERNTRFNYLPGTWRLYAWLNSRAQNYDGMERRNTGWGLSVDQKVLDDLTLFGRYGRHTSGRVRFDRALTLGAELDGTRWGRAADSVGLAFGDLKTSGDYHAYSLAVSGYQAGGSEKQSELYYRFKLNAAIELSPNFQWIRKPGGDGVASTIRIVGMRARLGF